MTELEIYEKVNKTETLEELANVIESLANDEGLIAGLSKSFDAKRMAEHCRHFNLYIANSLTRKYGIRQQAIYLIL